MQYLLDKGFEDADVPRLAPPKGKSSKDVPPLLPTSGENGIDKLDTVLLFQGATVQHVDKVEELILFKWCFDITDTCILISRLGRS